MSSLNRSLISGLRLVQQVLMTTEQTFPSALTFCFPVCDECVFVGRSETVLSPSGRLSPSLSQSLTGLDFTDSARLAVPGVPGLSCLWLSGAAVMSAQDCTQLFVRCRGSNSGSYAYKACALLMEPPLHPLKKLLVTLSGGSVYLGSRQGRTVLMQSGSLRGFVLQS